MDTCRAGHFKTIENIRTVSTKGKVQLRCKLCDKAAKAKYEQSRKNRNFVKCIVEGCPTQEDYRGLCVTHRKMQKPLEALNRLQKHETLLERIRARVVIDGNGCWLWQNRLINGYGYFSFNNERMLTHRGTFQAFYNTTLSSKDVLDHLCMIKSCCNPEHLQRVTQRENAKRSQAYYALEEKYAKLAAKLKQLGYSDEQLEHIANGEKE
jgi:hypothetical protein